jgi:D-alanyl-lipoteichoic acid acyltransferase DltB (MBOAT superfamily)
MVDAMAIFGYNGGDLWTLNIILPVGISFYTFQTMSYSLDIYYQKVKPTRDFVGFATFVGFFPQLVAGPIERASSLLPQILRKRQFDYKRSVEGLGLILWGLFKKVAIADSLAPIVDDIFSNYHNHSSATLVMGAIFFGFQIYGDFSGYSDIAIGTAKLLGIELRSNFKFPYFSRNIAEFWRRWHISLSSWFRDYLYIPMGGSRVGKVKVIRNVLIIFLVSGFWHGANWTFIFWGLFHAILFIPIFLGGTHRRYLNTISVYFKGGFLLEIIRILITFSSVTLGWILFRSENISSAWLYYKRMLTDLTLGTYHHPMNYRMADYFILLGVFILYEYRIRKDERNPFKTESKMLRFLLYALAVLGLLLFFDDKVDRSFIYFQF